MSDVLSMFFGRKSRTRRGKKSPGRRPKRGNYVRKLPKSKAYVTVRGRRRKLYRGKNGGLYYRTKSGRRYIAAKVLKRKGHMLSPSKKRRVRRVVKKLRKRRSRKLKMTKKAIAARRAYRKRVRAGRRRSRFGDY